MMRIAVTLKHKPGFEVGYVRRHNALWPERA
jgi:L-rhamnose mutarotase